MARDFRNLSRQVAIIGVAESDEMGILPHKSSLQMHAESAWNAMEDAGVKKEEIDATFNAGMGPGSAEYFGIVPRYTDTTTVGSSSFVIHVGHAAMAIANGLCEMALITHGATAHSRPDGRSYLLDQSWHGWQGVTGPAAFYSLEAMRHMHQYGTTHDDFAEIAVAARKWAQLNPKALMREPMTIEDYHNSSWVSYPFHQLDCGLATDGGGAIILTSAERAQNYKRKPVYILGFGESKTHADLVSLPDLTWPAPRISGPRAMQMAGIDHKDLDFVELEDSFTYTVGVTLESLGFCDPGEFGQFVKGQRTAPRGQFPMNTSGGALSYANPGVYGIFAVIEAVRQLRGECGDRQVPNAKVGLAHGTGDTYSSTGTVILSNQ